MASGEDRPEFIEYESELCGGLTCRVKVSSILDWYREGKYKKDEEEDFRDALSNMQTCSDWLYDMTFDEDQIKVTQTALLFESLQSMREAKVLTDLVLVAGDQRIECHRVILASFSPYIRRLVHSSPKKSLLEMNIQDIDFEILSILLDFVYAKECTITADNAERIVDALDVFQIESTRKPSILRAMGIKEGDGLAVLRLSRNHGLESLNHSAVLGLRRDIFLCDETSLDIMTEINEAEILEFIEDNRNVGFCYEVESDTLDIAVKWVKAKPDGYQCFETILKHIEWNKVSSYDIDAIASYALRGNTRAQKMIEDAINSKQTRPPREQQPILLFGYESPFQVLEDSLRQLHATSEDPTTDVVIHVKDEQIHCHKAILAAASIFFKKMLTSDLKEKQEDEIHLHGTDFKTMSHIVDAIYGGELKLHGDIVQDILMSCHQYEMHHFMELCTHYIALHMDCDNCIDIYLLGSNLELNLLQERAILFLELNSEDITELHRLTDSDWWDIISSVLRLTPNILKLILKWAEEKPIYIETVRDLLEKGPDLAGPSYDLKIGYQYESVMKEKSELLKKANAFEYLNEKITQYISIAEEEFYYNL